MADAPAPPGTAELRASPYEAALISIRWFEADDNTSLTPEYLRKILLELGFTHPVEAPNGT